MPKTNCCNLCGWGHMTIDGWTKCKDPNCECHKNVCCSNCMSYYGGCVMPDCRCHNGGASCHGGEKDMMIWDSNSPAPKNDGEKCACEGRKEWNNPKNVKHGKYLCFENPKPQPPADWEEQVYARSRNAEVAGELVRIIRQVEKEAELRGAEVKQQFFSAQIAQARLNAFAEIEKFVEENESQKRKTKQVTGEKYIKVSALQDFIKENKTK